MSRARNSDHPHLVLVQAPPVTLLQPPLGVSYLSSFLRSEGWSTRVLDVNAQLLDSPSRVWRDRSRLVGAGWVHPYYSALTRPRLTAQLDQIADSIAEQSPLVVGISCTSFSVHAAEDLLQRIRERRPQTLFLAGGSGVAGPRLREKFSRQGFDYLVVGEAEHTLQEFLAVLSAGSPQEKIAEIPGLIPWACASGDPYDRFVPRPLEQNLERFPFPTFEELDLSLYSTPVIPLLLSRGCTGHCKFCVDKPFQGHFRPIPVETVFENLRYHVGGGRRQFAFNDLSLTGSLSNLERLADLILEARLEVSLGGLAALHAGIQPPLLRKLKQAGFSWLCYGAESFCDSVLQRLGKQHNTATTVRVVRDTAAAGITPNLLCLVGFPGESEADFAQSLQFLSQHPDLAQRVEPALVCTALADSELGRSPETFGIQPFTGKRLEALLWQGTGPEATTFEERMDRLYRLFEQRVGAGGALPSGVWDEGPDCVIALLPSQTRAAEQRAEFHRWASELKRELAACAVRVEVVDIEEALRRAVERLSAGIITEQTEGVDSLWKRLALFLDSDQPLLPWELEECLESLLFPAPPLVVLFHENWNESLLLGFAGTLAQADRTLFLAGAGPCPTSGAVPQPFSAWLVEAGPTVLRHLVRGYRATLQMPAPGSRKYLLSELPTRPLPRLVDPVVLEEFSRSSGRFQVGLRIHRSLRSPLVRLGLHDTDSAEGAFPLLWRMPTPRLRAGSLLRLSFALPSLVSRTGPLRLVLQVLVPKPRGGYREVLSELLAVPRAAEAAPGVDLPGTGARSLLEVEILPDDRSDLALQLLSYSAPPRLVVPPFDKKCDPLVSNPVLDDICVWPSFGLTSQYEGWRHRFAEDVEFPSDFAAAQAPLPPIPGLPAAVPQGCSREKSSAPAAQRNSGGAEGSIHSAAGRVWQVAEQLGDSETSPLPGWKLSAFRLARYQGVPALLLSFEKAKRSLRLALVSGDTPLRCTVGTKRLKLLCSSDSMGLGESALTELLQVFEGCLALRS